MSYWGLVGPEVWYPIATGMAGSAARPEALSCPLAIASCLGRAWSLVESLQCIQLPVMLSGNASSGVCDGCLTWDRGWTGSNNPKVC